MLTYYIYILFSESLNKYYIGYSQNPWNRLIQHLENSSEKFTAKANDWKLKAVFEVSIIEAEAIRMERFIKKQKSRKLIEQLCELNFIPNGYLAHLVRVPHVRD